MYELAGLEKTLWEKVPLLTSLPNELILDLSRLNAFTDDKLNGVQVMQYFG